MSEKNIFQRIIDREIPSNIIYEDEQCLAFTDTNPQAPVHFLVIPKRVITSLAAIGEQDQALLGHLMLVIRDLAQKQGIAEQGFRVVSNCGDYGGQTVYHLHFHVLGGRPLLWPPG